MKMLIILLLLFAAGIMAVHSYKSVSFKQIFQSPLFVLIAGGLLIRLAAALYPESHPVDYGCFAGWSDALFREGFGNFYQSKGFTDYPPGYMYILFILGWLKNFLGITFASYDGHVLIKLPAMLCDVFLAVMLFSIGKKRVSEKTAYGIALLYCFNPAVIFVSSVWGQVDSVLTLLLLASVYLLTEKKIFYASLLFALGILVKPQAFMFTPVYLYYFYQYIKDNQFSVKSFFTLAGYGVICFAVMFLFILPFAPGFNFVPVVEQYISTLSSYNYATVNAYNLYALLGQNWTKASQPLLGASYSYWGTAALAAITLLSLYQLFRNKEKSNTFFTGALIVASTFMFSVKMHERYAFPVMALLLAASIYKDDKRLRYLYGGFSLGFLINYIDVFRISVDNFNYANLKYTAMIFPVFIIVPFVYMVYLACRSYGEDKAVALLEPAVAQSAKMGKKDYVAICAITYIYAVVAFLNLGNTISPQSMYQSNTGDSVVVDFGQDKELSRVQYFLGVKDKREYSIDFSRDGQNFDNTVVFKADAVFRWGEYTLNTTGRYARITSHTQDSMMGEIAFRDTKGNIIPIVTVSPIGSPLFDEQDTVPQRSDYMNSTYFDEVYHPRTAYEFLEKLTVLEYSHPPLGKVIISLGIKIFGMTPFGWRFMGTLFGVFMVPVLFLFGKKMFHSTEWAAFATLIFTFDFMHYAQTRLATIDTYITIFVMLMYYFMYQYRQMNFYRDKLGKTLAPLFFSGLFMGIGIACKWPGIYAGAGLALLFFLTLLERFFEYAKSKRAGEASPGRFWRNAAITCFCCLFFFILIPAVIYLLSYIPFYNTNSLYPIRDNIPFLKEHPALQGLIPHNGLGDYIAAVIQNQFDMFNYHSGLTQGHPYSSTWWQWIIDWRPIYYYSGSGVGDGMRQGISSFGNPALWWAGLPAFCYCVYRIFKKADKISLFLVIGYIAQLLPWVLVTRVTFIYHYFPCVPFVALMVTYMFATLCLKKENRKYAMIYLGVTVGLFILFYPVLTGIPMNVQFVNYTMKWFFMPMWQLI